MRVDDGRRRSELTGKPTYLRAMATGTVSDYNDAYGIDNHVYDFADKWLLSQECHPGAFLGGQPGAVWASTGASSPPTAVPALARFISRRRTARCRRPRRCAWLTAACPPPVGGTRSPKHFSGQPVARPPTLRGHDMISNSQVRQHLHQRPTSIERPAGTGHHPGLHTGADVGA